ncbi:SEC-C metal-binding domain-containing protein [Pseudomonas akapageensis]|uniref:SEC-C metal-binding domain-containing protein n=1 Tax=Pseudomonas akapageensis TaxID=2609961 RepID=UPI0014092A4B|nr:SEC-C metal-binding domain-containing protein [Pseudomonas akapageensis]
MDVTRTESEIFLELEKLCSSPGYLHAIALLSFRDNAIKYADTMTVENVLEQFTTERLTRTELSTLIGLSCKSGLDITSITPTIALQYIEKTQSLLEEIHNAMFLPVMKTFKDEKSEAPLPIAGGAAFRESIFYGGEGAYNFQYRDLSSIKYKKDNSWFEKNKKFSVAQANDIISAIDEFQSTKLASTRKAFSTQAPETWTFLPAFTFTVEDISSFSGIDTNAIQAFIDAFTLPIEMLLSFSALDDFNASNAFPIIKISETGYISFQSYSLSEALYETPFFWLNSDPQYTDTARKHRGEFTEEFSAERLKLVFGEKNVHTNIDIYKNKKTRVGEIDVLVVYADRAIILQAKSKKLTLAARKGNDNILRDDFKKAIQDANDQAFLCAGFLLDEAYTLIDSEKNELILERNFKEIYPVCVISEHYPALSFQSRQFLKFQTTETIKPTLVMDVFLLDVMSEMLQTPLYFLSYINKRTTHNNKIMSNHELTILSYHLKQNLWVENDNSMVFVEDNVGAELDLAMFSRRLGAPGPKTPEGILTKFKGTEFDSIITDIESLAVPQTIDFGFLLLELSGDLVEQFNTAIKKITQLSKADGKHHDIVFALPKHSTGLTIHCNEDSLEVAGNRLRGLCTLRKYEQKAKSWFGICISPNNAKLKFGISLTEPWEHSSELDEATKRMPKPQQRLRDAKGINFTTKVNNLRKIGRNEKCSCGSGKKYKNCCIS